VIQTQNPATGKIERSFQAHSEAEIEDILARSFAAFKELKSWSFERRAEHMRRAADILENEAAQIGEIVTREMGKTFKSAIAEVQKCAKAARYYAETASVHLGDEIIETEGSKAFRAYLPLGPVLAVMPWNYPIWQVIRFAAPALMAGNTGLLKHASNVPQCALYIEDVFRRAGFPDGAFLTLLVPSSQVERVLRDARVKAATLTGSEPAGASVASICGQEIKPTVLELGGSDVFIIMPSADIDQAVSIACLARTQNNGQSCIAAKRFIAHADIYDEVREKLVRKFDALNVGDPMSPDTDVGPLVNESSLQEVESQVAAALASGATLLTGGVRIEGPGYYFRPGILEGVPRSSPTFHEEIFGPVAALYKARDLDEAIDLANDSPFGLGSSIWTTESDEQERAIRELETGATFVNAMTASDPRLPFGGVKRSGYGRELAAEGIRAFCNVKTAFIA
jgi:succinate-semialdehyde dehydrogenase/glutarate-semialdehyde dehydrogenase